MEWISSVPPKYVWRGDRWYNEKNRRLYFADVDKLIWVDGEDVIPFPPKTQVRGEKNGR